MPKPEFIYISYIETTPEQLWEAGKPLEIPFEALDIAELDEPTSHEYRQLQAGHRLHHLHRLDA
jgi:hypothetical protein